MEAVQNPIAVLPLYMAYLRGLAPEWMTLIGEDTSTSLIRREIISLRQSTQTRPSAENPKTTSSSTRGEY